MATALNIGQAINLSLGAVRYHALDDATLAIFVARIDSWITALGFLDGENVQERTVKNWKVPTQEIRTRLTTVNLLDNMSDLGITLFNTCSAAKYAALDGRISAAQLAAVLAAWNTNWGW